MFLVNVAFFRVFASESVVIEESSNNESAAPLAEPSPTPVITKDFPFSVVICTIPSPSLVMNDVFPSLPFFVPSSSKPFVKINSPELPIKLPELLKKVLFSPRVNLPSL